MEEQEVIAQIEALSAEDLRAAFTEIMTCVVAVYGDDREENQ